VCQFELWLPITRLEVSTLGLYDDARFPGRCLLALNAHFEDLREVPSDIAASFMHDTQRAATAIADVVVPDRLNYAILGNVVPHIHMHIIPRMRRTDPNFGRPPWERSDKAVPLSARDRESLTVALKESLTGAATSHRVAK
jgi:diadenosine tetraphosphate (Ap4A) HIT family hydrolase